MHGHFVAIVIIRNVFNEVLHGKHPVSAHPLALVCNFASDCLYVSLVRLVDSEHPRTIMQKLKVALSCSIIGYHPSAAHQSPEDIWSEGTAEHLCGG